MNTREKIDKLGNNMLIDSNMPIRDIQANTLSILSSMYNESRDRHEQMANCIENLDTKMKIITWIGGIIAGAIILNILGNILSIPEIKSFSEENQANQTEIINK
jgi:hypothetical protein